MLPIAAARILAPLPVPPSIRDFLCFEAHYKKAYEELFRRIASHEPDPEAAYESYRRAGKLGPPPHWYDRPTYGFCNRFAVVGPDAEIRRPSGVTELDYELELACVVGRPGRDITVGEAAAHIFGYTIFNDFSARDLQAENMRRGEGGRGSAKEFDTGYALGPCIVTADEIGDPDALEMTARVNGVEWSRGNSRDMYHGSRGSGRRGERRDHAAPRRDPGLRHGGRRVRARARALPSGRRHDRAGDREDRRAQEPRRARLRKSSIATSVASG